MENGGVKVLKPEKVLINNYYRIMEAIYMNAGINITELCTASGHSNCYTTDIVNELARSGFLEKAKKGREQHLYLTKKGEDELIALSKSWLLKRSLEAAE